MKLVAAFVSTALLLSLGCSNDARNASVKAANDGAKALGQNQWETAIERYEKATQIYRDNHAAWYYLGYAFSKKGDWKKAVDAGQTAIQIEPGQAMYQLFYGVALYEKAWTQAREQQAASLNKKPDEIAPDVSGLSFEKPLQHLQEAVKLNNELWRAHYYLGRIYRDTGKVKEAAEEFTKALQSVPAQSGPWVALADLYLAWDYTEQALAVATQGVSSNIMPDSNEVGTLWYVVGLAYDDKALYEKSIDAGPHARPKADGCEWPVRVYSVEELGFSGRVFFRLQGAESEKSQQVSVEPNRDDSGEAGTFLAVAPQHFAIKSRQISGDFSPLCRNRVFQQNRPEAVVPCGATPVPASRRHPGVGSGHAAR